jgi:hypothetical protein
MLVSAIALPICYLIAVGAYHYGKTQFTPFQTSSDDSPIIITDGGSVHFAQYDEWYYKPHEISAVLPGHHAHKVTVQLCTPNADHAAGTCDADMIASSCTQGNCTLTGSGWDLYLCSSKPCNRDTYGAKVSLDKNGTWYGESGTDVTITPFNRSDVFESEVTTLQDGPSFKLGTVNLKWVELYINGNPRAEGDCHLSNPANKKCVITICYNGKNGC